MVVDGVVVDGTLPGGTPVEDGGVVDDPDPKPKSPSKVPSPDEGADDDVSGTAKSLAEWASFDKNNEDAIIKQVAIIVDFRTIRVFCLWLLFCFT